MVLTLLLCNLSNFNSLKTPGTFFLKHMPYLLAYLFTYLNVKFCIISFIYFDCYDICCWKSLQFLQSQFFIPLHPPMKFVSFFCIINIYVPVYMIEFLFRVIQLISYFFRHVLSKDVGFIFFTVSYSPCI